MSFHTNDKSLNISSASGINKSKAVLKILIPMMAAVSIIFSSLSGFAVNISAKGAFVMDADTGEALFVHNADTPVPPASMTKVLALYVIYSHMASGELDKDTQIPVGSALAAYSRDPGYSNVYLSAGATYSLDELLKAICVVSANAAVMAVGDYICGSEENFVAEMNYWLGVWGVDGYFVDCTGVSSKNRISPRGMATVASKLISEYPDVLNYTSLTYLNFRGASYYPTNKMLPGGAYEYAGADGLKTGTTSAAGCCFTGTATRNGKRLVSVVMGESSTNMRYVDTIKMMDYCWDLLASRGDTYNEAYIDNTPKDFIVATDMRCFINDWEIPTFIHYGNAENGYQDCAVVMLEDLKDYGFDVSYDLESDTVTIINNVDKDLTAGPNYGEQETYVTDEKLALSNWEPAKILLKNGYDDPGVYAESTFDINGRGAISIDELWHMGTVVWNRKYNLTVVVTRY